jgi:hypothetical protein
MRFFRTSLSVVVFLMVGLFGASGSACDGCVTTPPSGPDFETWLDFASGTFNVYTSNGMPGAPGLFNFYMVTGPTPGLFQAAFTYDGSGAAHLSIPVSVLLNGADCIIGMNCVSIGTDGNIHESGIWALATRNYVVTDPNNPPCASCPTSPGCVEDWVTWPGANDGLLYPHCLMAIDTGDARGGSQPMMALESGPAGSFPIN